MTLTVPSTTPSRTCSARYATRRRPERPTFGGELARIAAALGQPFMPHQRLVADVGGEYDPETGIPFYREVIFTKPRQNGKTAVSLSWQIHRCTAPRWRQPQRSAFTAQSGRDARDKWLDELYPLIEASGLFSLVKGGKRGMARGMGNEHIRWVTGSLIRLLSTSTSSGHSKTLQQAVLDELWHDTDDRREQGIRPAMITVADAQLLVCSTAGTHTSTVLNRKVKAGRKAVAEDTGRGVAYFDWGAPDGWDPDDEESYYTFMPALCPDPPCRCDPAGEWRHQITMDVIRMERQAMEDPEFRRAYGNVYTFAEDASPLVDTRSWAALADRRSRAADPTALALAITPEHDAAAVAVAGARRDGLVHGEIIDHRPGVAWSIDRVAQLNRDWKPCAVVVRGTGPVRSLIPHLEAAGVELLVANGADWAGGCGDWLDAVTEGRLRYLDHPALNAAVAGARQQPSGNLWTLVRRDPSVDVSPAEALVLAMYGHAVRGHEPEDLGAIVIDLDWQCAVCRTSNNLDRTACKGCGRERET